MNSKFLLIILLITENHKSHIFDSAKIISFYYLNIDFIDILLLNIYTFLFKNLHTIQKIIYTNFHMNI